MKKNEPAESSKPTDFKSRYSLHTKPLVAIIGVSVRAAAYSARRAGFRTTTCDWFGDRDLCEISDWTPLREEEATLLSWCEKIAASEEKRVAWFYTGGLENAPKLVQKISKLLPLAGVKAADLESVRNPYSLAKIAAQGGFLFPATQNDFPTEGIENWLVKNPTLSGGGHVQELTGLGVRSRTGFSGKPFKIQVKHQDSEFHISKHEVYQKKITGKTYAAIFVAQKSGLQQKVRFLGLTQQLSGGIWGAKKTYQYVGSVGPVELSEQIQKEIIQLGTYIASECHLQGLFGMDVIVDEKEQLWLLEVNPRYTASVEVLERGLNIAPVLQHLDPLKSFAPEDFQRKLQKRFCGKAILYAKKSQTISAELSDRLFLKERFLERKISTQEEKNEPTLADIPQPGTKIDAGDPVLTVFEEGDSLSLVQSRLRTRLTEIESLVFAEEAKP